MSEGNVFNSELVSIEIIYKNLTLEGNVFNNFN